MAKYWGVALAVGSVALAGCSSTIFKPFDADKGSVSMDARQRAIISVERGTPPETHRIVCAEPSPDALATIAASAAGSAGVSGIPEVPGSAELAASLTRAEQAAMIGARNSTIQLLRDGLYRACEAYMNGALGDFGYGLVLVNYGRVMVSLLTADGLVRPPLVAPVVIGSLPGDLKTHATGSGGLPQAKPAAAEPMPAAAPSHDASADVGAGAALPAGSAAGAAASGPISGDQAERIFENVVLPLANPSVDPAGKLIEVTVACMLWLDRTGLRAARSDADASLQNLCEAVTRQVPQLAAQAIAAKFTVPGAGTNPVPGTRSASLQR
jgi:hypothetical protein